LRYLGGMSATYGMVLTTISDPAAGQRLAAGLLEQRLAACVQTLPIQSTYRWQGAIQHEAETLMLIKTRTELYPAVEAYLRAHHPYEVPEILLLPVTAGLPAYLQWLQTETADP
jgi:periplasmic divalent cation tolerance protein